MGEKKLPKNPPFKSIAQIAKLRCDFHIEFMDFILTHNLVSFLHSTQKHFLELQGSLIEKSHSLYLSQEIAYDLVEGYKVFTVKTKTHKARLRIGHKELTATYEKLSYVLIVFKLFNHSSDPNFHILLIKTEKNILKLLQD